MSREARTGKALSDEDRVLWNLVARSAKPLKGRKPVEDKASGPAPDEKKMSATAAPAPAAAAATAPAADAPAPAPLVLRPMRPREELFVLRSACGADVRRLCGGVAPGGGRIVQCLAVRAASLSPACKDVLAQFAAQ